MTGERPHDVSRRSVLKAGATLASLLGLGHVLAACGSDDPDNGSSDAPGKNSAARTTVTIAFPDTPGALDSDQGSSANIDDIIRNCYGGDILRMKVVKDTKSGQWRENFDATGFDGLDKALAESYEVSDDLTEFTFHLRKDVKSVYGNPLIADDVVWSWQRRVNFKNSFSTTAGVTEPGEVTKIDDHTVRFKLTDPNVLFMKVDAIIDYGGLHDSVEAKKHATKDDPWAIDWISANCGAYGPYSVQSFKKGSEVVLAANPNYFRGLPPMKKIVWRVVPDPSVRLAMLTRGDVDVVTSLSARDLQTARKTKGVEVVDFVSNQMISLQLQNSFKPLDDYRVRQALSYATPVDEIISTVYNGTATPLKSFFTPVTADYTDEYWIYGYNIDTAKSMLAEAGVSGLSLEVIYDISVPEEEAIGQIIKTAYAKAGVNIKLTGMPSAQFWERRGKRDFHAAIGWNYPFVLDPAYVVQLFFLSTHTGNWANYKNPAYDQVYYSLAREVDVAKRSELARRAQQIWMHDQPWIAICNPGYHVAYRSGLTGFVWGSDNAMRFEKLAHE